MNCKQLLVTLVMLAAPAFAVAQPAVVEAVQYPAWLERGGQAVPLAPGLQLEARDSLHSRWMRGSMFLGWYCGSIAKL